MPELVGEFNIRETAKKASISYDAAYRHVKALVEKRILKERQVGKAIIYSLNLNNPVTIREIDSILTIEASNHQRWVEEFRKLEGITKCVVLFGSILRNEKEARNIDLFVISKKKNYSKVKKVIEERNKIQLKLIHLIFQTPSDFRFDLNRKYEVTIEIIKTGIVLYGQDELRKLVTEK